MKKELNKVHEILLSKESEMKEFMKHYAFKKNKKNIETFVDDKVQFLEFIDFCLNTRRKSVEEHKIEGKQYFNKNYDNIIRSVEEKDVAKLRSLVCDSPGVGQKIGSMILEFIFLYSRHRDEAVIKELYVPIDTHVKRIFKYSFGMETPEIGWRYGNKKFQEFQDLLDGYSNNKGRIYFDYLWFVGKVFCTKMESKNSKGYKLCQYCWIKEYCKNKDKWS